MSSSFQLNEATAFMITAAQWLTFQDCDISRGGTGDIILSTFPTQFTFSLLCGKKTMIYGLIYAGLNVKIIVFRSFLQ